MHFIWIILNSLQLSILCAKSIFVILRLYLLGLKFSFDGKDGQMHGRIKPPLRFSLRWTKKALSILLLSYNKYFPSKAVFLYKKNIFLQYISLFHDFPSKVLGKICANDENSLLVAKQRVDVIETLHVHLLQWQPPVTHLYPTIGGLHINVQFLP